MEKYDVLIVAHEKDFLKLKYLIKSIKDFINYKKIYIITNIEIDNKSLNVDDDIIICYEETILKINKNKINYRHNWIYQQFLKLFQNITEDNYIVIDSDVIINRNIYITPDNFYFTSDQNHKPYFNFYEKIFGSFTKFKHSFISELMIFDRKKIQDMLISIDLDNNSFIEKCYDIINNDCYISEFEMYGNWIYNKYNTINENYLKSFSIGREKDFDDNEIINHINENKNKEIDLFVLHTWKNTEK